MESDRGWPEFAWEIKDKSNLTNCRQSFCSGPALGTGHWALVPRLWALVSGLMGKINASNLRQNSSSNGQLFGIESDIPEGKHGE